MGLVFEELIRKFAEISNETAGEHFTPRDVIRLMVNLLFIEDDEALTRPGVVRTIYDPTAGTGGMLSVGRGVPGGAEPPGPADHVRAGAQPRVLRHLQGGHADQGPGCLQHRLRQHPLRRRAPGQALRLHALQSALRRGLEEDRDGDPQGAPAEGLRRSLRPGLAPGLGRVAAVPAASDLQDAPGRGRRQPHRHRPQRLAALHRRCRLRRERNPPLRAGERPGGGHRRPAHGHVLQHRHQHLRLDALQPQARAPQGQGPAHRRQPLLAEDAQEPGQQAQGDVRGAHRHRHPPLRRASPRPTWPSSPVPTARRSSGGS